MRLRAAAVFLLLIAAWAPCQETGSPTAPARRILIVVGADGASLSRSEILLLSKSLGLALSEATSSLKIIEYGDSSFPQDPEKRALATEERQADCWLRVGVSGEKSAPVLNIKSFDLLVQATLIEQTLPLEASLESSGTFDGKWEPLVSLLLEKLQLQRSTSAGTSQSLTQGSGQKLALLTIRAMPGTVVSGLPAGKLDVGIDGVVMTSLDAPASYTFRSSRAGYDPVTTRVFLDDNREVAIEQKTGTRWSADLTFTNSLFPGVDGRFYAIRNWLFVEAGITAYIFGLQLNGDQVLFSLPLTNLTVQLGGYLNAEDALFRLYGSLGAFLRFQWDFKDAEYPVRFNPLSPLGFQASLGTEMVIGGDFRFFLEYTPMLYMSKYPELMHASLPDVPFAYWFFPWGTLSLANLRFGVRWLL